MLHVHLSPSFFLLVKTVEIKSPFSLSHSLMTPFFNPEMISLGMCFVYWFTYKVNFESPFDSFNNKSVRCYGTPLA